MIMRRIAVAAVAALFFGALGGQAQAQDIKIGLLRGASGPLEAYAKQTETGFTMGLEYLTAGTMKLNGHKITVVTYDDQGKPDLAKSLLSQAYSDDKVDIAVGTTSSGAALAMLPVAEDFKKILIVEPAVADSITGANWNRYIFRTARNSSQDALAGAAALADQEASIAFLAQDYAFGHDGVAAAKQALLDVKAKAKVVHEEYAPSTTTDFTAAGEHLINALKDKPGIKIIAIIWAGPNPLASSRRCGRNAMASPSRRAVTSCRRWPPTRSFLAWRAPSTITMGFPRPE